MPVCFGVGFVTVAFLRQLRPRVEILSDPRLPGVPPDERQQRKKCHTFTQFLLFLPRTWQGRQQ